MRRPREGGAFTRKSWRHQPLRRREGGEGEIGTIGRSIRSDVLCYVTRIITPFSFTSFTLIQSLGISPLTGEGGREPGERHLHRRPLRPISFHVGPVLYDERRRQVFGI